MTFQTDPTLNPFFNPKGIVLFGASTKPSSLGFGVARNLVQSGYPGAIHFINPKGGMLLERPLHPTLATIPDPVDLAVLLIPAPFAPQALVEVVSDALIDERGALSVSVEDADAGSESEQALFGGPGQPVGVHPDVDAAFAAAVDDHFADAHLALDAPLDLLVGELRQLAQGALAGQRQGQDR